MAFMRASDWVMSMSSATDCRMRPMGSYRRVTTSMKQKNTSRLHWPAATSAVPTRMVVTMPWRSSVWVQTTAVPVTSSEASFARSKASTSSFRRPKKSSARFKARTSRFDSKYSWMSSASARAAAFLPRVFAVWARLVASRISRATGTGHSDAQASRQSKTSSMTATITVEMPVPKAWGMVWLNRRSWSAASFMITVVRSARSRLPKNDSGSTRSRSARPIRLRALSWYTTL